MVDQRTRGPRNELTPTFPFCGPGAASSVSLWLTEQLISSGLRSRNLQAACSQAKRQQSRRGLVNPLSAGAADVVRPPTLSLPGGSGHFESTGHRASSNGPAALRTALPPLFHNSHRCTVQYSYGLSPSHHQRVSAQPRYDTRLSTLSAAAACQAHAPQSSLSHVHISLTC